MAQQTPDRTVVIEAESPRLVVRASSRNHRDWEAVDDWAASIARQLTAAVEISEPRS